MSSATFLPRNNLAFMQKILWMGEVFACLFFLSFALFSCASISPVTGASEEALESSSINTFSPLWTPLRENALWYCAGRIRTPRLEFWAVKVDLTDPSLHVVVSAPGEGFPFGVIPSQKVSSFVKETGAALGINTNPFEWTKGFWDKITNREGEPRRIEGLTISDGTLVSEPNPAYDALAFYNDGAAAIIHQPDPGDGLSALEKTRGIENAVGGFNIVLEHGVVAARLLDAQGQVKTGLPRAPRSAAGLADEGKTLFLLVVDGRRAGSVGATEGELGFLLARLGAEDGLNFDGGGSSSLVLCYPDGKVRPVNRPIHNRLPGIERAVASCLGLKYSE